MKIGPSSTTGTPDSERTSADAVPSLSPHPVTTAEARLDGSVKSQQKPHHCGALNSTGPLPDHATYRAGMAAIQAELEAEQELPLQAGAHSYFMVHQAPPPKGVIVLFHGFSSGAWQFEDIAEEMYGRGFNVFAVRMPGHGFRTPGGRDDGSHLPQSHQHKKYETFADHVHTLVKGLGGPIRVLGQSGGGAVATNFIRRHADVKQAVLFAPFLGIARSDARTIFGTLSKVDSLFGNYPGRVLNAITVDAYDGVDPRTLEGDPVSRYRNISLGSVYALHRFGREQARQAREINVPLQILSTVHDDSSGLYGIEELYNKTSGNDHSAWQHFTSSEDMPHAMAHIRDVRSEEKVQRVTDIAMNFFEKGEVSHNPGGKGR